MMKLKFTITISLILMAFSAHAQLSGLLKKNLEEIEIAIGPSMVSLYNENITKDIRQPKIGYMARLSLLFPLSEKLSVNSSLQYERKGLKTRFEIWYYDPSIDSSNCKCTTSLGTKENNSNMNYMTLAISLNYNINNTNFYIKVGPYISYLLKVHGSSRNLWDNSVSYFYGNQSMKKIDVGISVLLAYKIKIEENLAIALQVLDNYGMLNITDTKVSQTITKTNSFTFLLGLQYKIN